MLLALVLTTSCLNSSSESTLYSDAAISSFSLGTLYRYEHVKTSAGTDTVYKRTLVGSNYKFQIDQVNHRIYNSDSLPLGTDVAHVICSIGSVSNSLITIKDLNSDTVRVYNSTDSIDFTSPREFYVYSTDGNGYTKYDVRVNAHQQDEYTLTWQRMDDAPGPEPDNYDLPMDGIRQIIGSCSTETYALSDDGRMMVWRHQVGRWEEDLLDDDAQLLPTQDLALATYPMYLADDTEYVVLVGNRSTEQYPQEKTARVWRKIVDSGPFAPQSHWTYMEHTDNSQMTLLDRQITRTEDSLRVVRGQIDSMKMEYAKVVRTLYGLRGNVSSTSMMLDNETYNYSYLKMKYFKEYSRYRKHQAAVIQRREQLFQNLDLDLQRQRNEKVTLLAQERKQKDALAREQQKHQKNLDKSQQDERYLQQQISKKEPSAKADTATHQQRGGQGRAQKLRLCIR